MPMDWEVRASSPSIGVSKVSRASEISRVFRRRSVASVGIVVLALIAFVLAAPVAPSASAQSKDEVMAAFLLNFARYVEWPEDAFDQNDMPVQFCMLSSKEFEGIVAETVSGKTVADRPVLVRWTSDLSKTNGCHVLFIGREFGGSHSKAVDAVDGLSVFTVADQEGFAEAGGVANFLHADNRIRFEINPTAAKKAGLKISSRLLRLAKVVN